MKFKYLINENLKVIKLVFNRVCAKIYLINCPLNVYVCVCVCVCVCVS